MTTADTVMCDRYTDQPAVARFTGCGTSGACSAAYQFELQQIAEQSNQPIAFHPLAPAPVGLERDERTQLIAARMSAEQDADDLKKRNRDLYNQNTDLKEAVRKTTLRATQAEQANERLTNELAAVNAKLEALANEHADLKQDHSALQSAVGGP